MKRLLLVLGPVLLLTACAGPQPRPGTLAQYSTSSALLAGVYDTDMTFAELKRHGDCGLGTFAALDGELVALAGQFYQIKADGRAYRVSDDMRTPFACVTFFRPQHAFDLGPTRSLDEALETIGPGTNALLAIRVTGTFAKLKVRSVPRQEQPYPLLLDAAKKQTVFDYENVTGTLVGFRTPGYLQGVNIAGYHFHFLSSDRQFGGHVLDSEVLSARVDVQRLRNLHLVLSEEAGKTQISSSGYSDLKQIENAMKQPAR